MANMDKLELLDLDGIEFDEIEKIVDGLPYPAVHIGTKSMYFNRAFHRIIPEGQRNVKFYTSSEYVIISLTQNDDENTFHLNRDYEKHSTAINMPALLREKKIRKGAYKIYKCKQGYAFKRYEPVRLK